MKKFLIALLVIVVLVVAGLVAAPFLIPLDTYKRQIAQQVEAATGRALMIDGPVDLQFLPTIAVEAGDVRLANAEGADAADMIRLKALEVELEIWPLLRGAVEIDRFVLQEPEIHLEVDQDGRGNWEFSPPGAEAAPPETGEQPGADDQTAGSDGGGLPLSELKLGDIRIEDGTVTFTDRGSGTSERLDDVDLSISLPDLRSRLAAEGSFRYKDEAVALNLGVEQPLQLTQGGNSPVAASINSEPVAFGFRGLLDTGGAQQARGTIELDVTSIRSLAAWLGQPLELPGDGLEQLKIAGKLDATPTLISFADAAITLDDITAEGAVSADLGGAVPMLEGRLEVGEVDLNRYLPPPAPAEEGGEATTDAEPAAEGAGQAEADGAAGWSQEPIPIPKLDMAEVDFELSLNGLKVRELELGPTVLELALHDAVLDADLKEFALYGGRGSGTFEIDTGAAEPAIKQTFRLEGLQALPFLTAAADFERLEGTAGAELDLATRGRSEHDFVRNLSGQGQVLFEDGAVVGINLAQMVRNIGAAFTGGGGEVQKTDFAELGGSFTIERGVVSNDDLRLQAPVLRLAGSGRVNLPKRTINYRIEPKAAATLEGQGGEQEVAGILVPVVIKGSWEDPKIEPDLSAALGSAGESAEAVKQQLKQLEGQKDQLEGAAKNLKQQLEGARQGGDVKGLVEGVTGALGGQKNKDGQQQGKEGQQAPADPAQRLLKGLLGN